MGPQWMHTFRRAAALILVVAAAPFAVAVEADPEAPDFLRLSRHGDGSPEALQTAIASYRSAEGAPPLQVDLIGVVHVGDANYYQRLNERFQQYDALLYELVAPQGTRIPQGGGSDSGHPVAALQRGMQNLLGLESQKDHIDYTAANFVHADLSPAEMASAMRERGESPLSLALGALAAATREANKKAFTEPAPAEEVNPLALLLNPQAGRKLKVQLAEQFAAMGATEDMLGPAVNQTLIKDRNTAAMKVLQREIEQGRRRLGIFYGAAHMRDFAERLNARWGLQPAGVEWMTAWDLSPDAESQRPAVSPFTMFLQLLDSPGSPKETR